MNTPLPGSADEWPDQARATITAPANGPHDRRAEHESGETEQTDSVGRGSATLPRRSQRHHMAIGFRTYGADERSAGAGR